MNRIILICTILACTSCITYAQNDTKAVITRWHHETEKDWVDQSNLIANEYKMKSWGYGNPTYLLTCPLTKDQGMTGLYRYRQQDKDTEFVTTTDILTTPKQMMSWGYVDRKLLCYIYTKKLGKDYVEVSRWFHPKEKDWVTTTESVTTDNQMKSWGYEDKKILGYYKE